MRDVFAFTDVHGDYELFHKVMRYCRKQDPDAAIIFLGDACDRGPDGYLIMKELLDDPHIIYLKGNHEDMFVHAARFILNDYKGSLEQQTIRRYLYALYIKDYIPSVVEHMFNGGRNTLFAWMLDGMSEEFVNQIARLPLTFSYEKLDFCHAGGDYETFQRAADAEYEGEFVDKEDAETLLWDRMYLDKEWCPGRICVFGHTPVQYLAETNEPVVRETKIDLDVGTYDTKRIYVLNCLTMKIEGLEKNT